MLAETVKSIRQTEEQAAQIAKEADTCYWALIEQAKENAAQFRSGREKVAREKAAEMKIEADAENKRLLAEAEAASRQEIEELQTKAVKRQKKELEQARKRIAELDRIFKRIYEDDINGTISHERFLKLSAEYEAEQKELTEFVKVEQAAVDTYEQDRTDFDSFAAVIRKYVGIRELTPTIVNEFVKKIIVHAPDKSSGHRRQKIEIVWNFIGELEQDEDKQTVERQRKSRTA